MFDDIIVEDKVSAYKESFGISIVSQASADAFTYWAAIAVQPGESIMPGCSTLAVSGGHYLSMQVPSLAVLPAAYNYIYNEWAVAHPEHPLAMDRPSYEVYPLHFMPTDPFGLYIPLVK